MRVFVTGMFLCFAASSAPAAQEVTFHKDVEPILESRCQECHRPGGVAPMSLVTYADAKPKARLIKDAVAAKRMPPWFADPAHGQFSNDMHLSKNEIDTLVAWADSGAKEGLKKDAPAARTFVEGWTIGKPDAVIEMPNAFPVPAEGTVEYQYIVVPTGFTEDKWVQATETLPGSKSVVHHIVMIVRPPGGKFMEEAKPGIPFPEPKDDSPHRQDNGKGFFGVGTSVEIAGVYVPGGDAYVLQPGQARFIPKGSDLIFQMHYTANGKAASDRSRIGFIFAKEPPKERVVNTFIGNQNLHIPAGAPDAAVSARVTLYKETRLLSMMPHTHVRGKSFEYRATYPNGESEILLTVPKYDFNWQLTYYLKEPKVLPAGTVLECLAHYDNSANNPSNPNPNAEVWWGDQTWDEMLAGFVDLAMPLQQTLRDVTTPPKRPATGF